jgi:hypothetical protein
MRFFSRNILYISNDKQCHRSLKSQAVEVPSPSRSGQTAMLALMKIGYCLKLIRTTEHPFGI